MKYTSGKPSPILAMTAILLLVVLVGLACKMPTGSPDASGTQAALDAQSTQLALRQTEVALLENENAAAVPATETPAGPDLEATLQSTQVEGLQVRVEPSTSNKCARCWNRRQEVGHLADQPELCQRCSDAVARMTG